jgi:hypothetical protein
MRRICHLRAARAIFLVAALLPSAAFAQEVSNAGKDRCAAPNVRTDLRPNTDGPPTKVTIGMQMIDLMGVDDISQTLTGDFAVVLNWTDSRLAHLKGCEILLQDIWEPGITVLNSGRRFPKLPKEAEIGPGGSVRYIQRYGGTFATYHNLRDFPFDKQIFRIWLVPSESPEDDVVLTVDENATGRRELLNISNWTIDRVNVTLDNMYIETFDRYHSRFTFEIHANRITAYYVWKVLLPLCLIVAMSWAVFWIDPAQFGTQIGLSATATLTLIAFIFATTNMLPALGYFTRLDLFIGGATILVFLALLQSLTTSSLVTNDKAELALHLDRVSRVLFPLVFVVFVILVIFS